MREFGIESLSSTQVSPAAKLRDDELEAWRNRPLGEIRYLIPDARYEKMRHGGVVRDAAVLSAIGIGPDERRRILGVSVALSQAVVRWRGFLESLVARGMRGVEFVVSDDHAGGQLLFPARLTEMSGTWTRRKPSVSSAACRKAANEPITSSPIVSSPGGSRPSSAAIASTASCVLTNARSIRIRAS